MAKLMSKVIKHYKSRNSKAVNIMNQCMFDKMNVSYIKYEGYIKKSIILCNVCRIIASHE